MFARTTGRLFTGTFKALFSDFDAFIRIVWAWYLLVAVISVAGRLFAAQSVAVIIATGLVFFCASASIAVAWHRNLLLREAPASMHLAFGRRELAYLLKTLLIMLIMVVPMAISLAVALPFLTGASFIAFLVAGSLLLLLLTPPFMRMCLILPATALDEKLGIAEAFRDSDGLGLPMAVAGIGVGLIVSALQYGLGWFVGALGAGSLFGVVALFILTVALQIAVTALQIGVLTGGYYILRERHMPRGAGPPAAD